MKSNQLLELRSVSLSGVHLAQNSTGALPAVSAQCLQIKMTKPVSRANMKISRNRNTLFDKKAIFALSFAPHSYVYQVYVLQEFSTRTDENKTKIITDNEKKPLKFARKQYNREKKCPTIPNLSQRTKRMQCRFSHTSQRTYSVLIIGKILISK